MAKKSSNKKSASKKHKSKQQRKKSKSVKKNSKPSIFKGIKLDKDKGLGLYIRIKSQLWREFKGDFLGIDYRSKDSQFLSVVHDVYDECRLSGSPCTEKAIRTKYREIIGELKRPKPFLPPDLISEPTPYWTIKDVEFETFYPYLYIKSPMIFGEGRGFMVYDYVKKEQSKVEGYYNFFKNWVDWCNYEFRNSTSEDYDAYFIFSNPIWNEEDKRWETTIYITTSSGKVDNFGYTPTGSPSLESLPKDIDEIIELSQEEEEKEKEQEKEIKESETDRLNKYKESIRKDILLYHEIGEEELKQEAIKKLKAINQKLDDINRLKD